MVEMTDRVDMAMHLTRKSIANGYEVGGVRNMNKLALIYDKADDVTKKVKAPSAVMDMMDEQLENTSDAASLKSAHNRSGFIRKDLQGIHDTRFHSDGQIGIRLLAEEHPGSIIRDYEENIISDGIEEVDAETNLAGLIFMCNKRTMKDCFHLSLFGLPSNMWNLVRQVVPGTVLFLFEYEARQMWGIYEATTFGQLNIEPSAYKHSHDSFPAQVRFKELEKCPPLKEKEFKEAIRDNYWSDMKFNFALSQDQVYRLSRIFLSKLDGINLSSVNEYRTLEVEEYIPLECNQMKMLDWYEDQVYGTPSDYCTAQRRQAALRRSLSDRSDQGLLSAKDDDVSYIENGFLLKENYPANFSNNVSEKKWNEFHLHTNGSIHSLHNNEVNFLSSSNTEVDRIANSRRRQLLDINTTEYIPTASTGAVGSTQVMYERMMDEGRKMSRAGMESINKASQMVHADEVKHKSSVWYRLSGRDTAPLVSPSSLHREIGLQAYNSTALPSTQDRLEKAITCYGDDVDSRHATSIIDEPTLSDQPEIEYPVNFKRRKNPKDACIEKTHEKKRRKLIRPDLSEPIQSDEERRKDSGSLQAKKRWTDERYDLVQCKEINGNIIEGQKPAKKVNTNANAISLPSLELCERSAEKESVLCLNQSKGGNDLDVLNKRGFKERDIHVDAQPESSNQLAGDCPMGDQLAESGSSFERGAFMDTAAVTFDNLFKKESNILDERKTSEGQILINGVQEKARNERANSNSDMVTYEFNILDRADRPIVNGEAVPKKKSLGVDLNEPLCPLEHDNVFVHWFTGDTEISMNAQSSVTANDGHTCENVDSEPLLHLELTMVPSGLSSATLGEVIAGEASGHKDLVSQ